MCNLEENGAFVALWLFKYEIRRFVCSLEMLRS